jgi:hypothetical protein
VAENDILQVPGPSSINVYLLSLGNGVVNVFVSGPLTSSYTVHGIHVPPPCGRVWACHVAHIINLLYSTVQGKEDQNGLSTVLH